MKKSKLGIKASIPKGINILYIVSLNNTVLIYYDEMK